MYIVFLRHGIAEDRDWVKPDFERRLVPHGVDSLTAFYPKLIEAIRELAGTSRVEIWTSPKLRALETAELLAELSTWPLSRSEVSLADGDWTSLEEALRSTTDTGLIVLVGHEPDLGEWTRQLTGERLRIKKGAAVAIDLDPKMKETGHRGRVLWALLPKKI